MWQQSQSAHNTAVTVTATGTPPLSFLSFFFSTWTCCRLDPLSHSNATPTTSTRGPARVSPLRDDDDDDGDDGDDGDGRDGDGDGDGRD